MPFIFVGGKQNMPSNFDLRSSGLSGTQKQTF